MWTKAKAYKAFNLDIDKVNKVGTRLVIANVWNDSLLTQRKMINDHRNAMQ